MLYPYTQIINLTEMRDVTIARLIVGKRHCRVLILGKINSFVLTFKYLFQPNCS